MSDIYNMLISLTTNNIEVTNTNKTNVSTVDMEIQKVWKFIFKFLIAKN